MTELMDRLINVKCFNCDTRLHFWHLRDLLPRLRFRLTSEEHWFSERDPTYDAPRRAGFRCHDCMMDIKLARGRILLVESAFWSLFCLLFLAILFAFLGLPGSGPAVPLDQQVEQLFRTPGATPHNSRMPAVLATVLFALPASYFAARLLSYKFIKLERDYAPR